MKKKFFFLSAACLAAGVAFAQETGTQIADGYSVEWEKPLYLSEDQAVTMKFSIEPALDEGSKVYLLFGTVEEDGNGNGVYKYAQYPAEMGSTEVARPDEAALTIASETGEESVMYTAIAQHIGLDLSFTNEYTYKLRIETPETSAGGNGEAEVTTYSYVELSNPEWTYVPVFAVNADIKATLNNDGKIELVTQGEILDPALNNYTAMITMFAKCVFEVKCGEDSEFTEIAQGSIDAATLSASATVDNPEESDCVFRAVWSIPAFNNVILATTGEVPVSGISTSFKDVTETIDRVYSRNGRIYSSFGNEITIYDMLGVDVTAQNGSLKGNYAVVADGTSVIVNVQ